MTNTKQKILNIIAQRTRKEKPIGSASFHVFRIVSIGLCVMLLLAAIGSVGMFVFDFFEKSAIEEFVDQSIYSPAYFLFEYLVVAIICVVIFVYLYRKFDWPLVKQKNMIFVASVIGSLVLGFGVASLAEHLFFLRQGLQAVKETYVSYMPARKAQRVATGELLKASSTVVGTISKLTKNTDTIAISIATKTQEKNFIVKESVISEKLRLGEKIAVQISSDNETITRLKIIK